MWFSFPCLGIQVVFDYKCLYRQYAFGEHSSFSAISLSLTSFVFVAVLFSERFPCNVIFNPIHAYTTCSSIMLHSTITFHSKTEWGPCKHFHIILFLVQIKRPNLTCMPIHLHKHQPTLRTRSPCTYHTFGVG